ncbi:MAG TPA: fasciclin domain-containing protein [Marinagarivorans sp.]
MSFFTGKIALKQPVFKTLALAAAVISLAACGGGTQTPPVEEKESIFDIASADERFDSLELALITTGLDAALDDESATYTVFAPTDDAFAKLGDTLNALLSAPDTLSTILQYHVINGSAVDYGTAMSLAGSTQAMLNGDNIAITLQDGELYINNARVIVTDIEASNGIIHAIDTVITPPAPTIVDGTIADAAINTPELSTLVTALQAAGLVDALDDESANYTVFAPLNSAFDKIDDQALAALLADPEQLTDLLTYHVYADGVVDSITAISLTGSEVPMFNGDNVSVKFADGKLTINRSEVVTKDIVTNNGTVHLIDTVLMPPVGSIVDVAVADGRFASLVAFLRATGLDQTLADKERIFTVFAPTDDAFALLGDETIDALAADADALTNILLYHVVGDSAIDEQAAVAAAGTTVTSVNGSDVSIKRVGDKLYINSSEVIITDVMADNGIIHAVSSVIVPPGTIYDEAVKAGVFQVLSQALIAAGVDASVASAQATETVFQATGLDAVLADTSEQFTVFVPTAEAFAALGEETLGALAQSPDQLRDILLYHTVKGQKIDASEAIAAAGTHLTMADGNTASVSVNDGALFIKDAKVVETNIQASNGIIHFIDKVILP